MRCKVNIQGREVMEGICLGFFQNSEVVHPSPMIGGHTGGTVSYPVAVVATGGKTREFRASHVIFEEDELEEFVAHNKARYDSWINYKESKKSSETEYIKKEDAVMESINKMRGFMGLGSVVTREEARASIMEELGRSMERQKGMGKV